MAIFGSKTKKTMEKKPIAPKAVKVAKTSKAVAIKAEPKMMSDANLNASAHVIIRPRVTEKSGILSQGGVYTFEVTRDSNKQSISLAVKALYKVTPVKVTVLNSPARKTFIRGKRGSVPGFRKALVTVKKGDKIDFV